MNNWIESIDKSRKLMQHELYKYKDLINSIDLMVDIRWRKIDRNNVNIEMKNMVDWYIDGENVIIVCEDLLDNSNEVLFTYNKKDFNLLEKGILKFDKNFVVENRKSVRRFR